MTQVQRLISFVQCCIDLTIVLTLSILNIWQRKVLKAADYISYELYVHSSAECAACEWSAERWIQHIHHHATAVRHACICVCVHACTLAGVSRLGYVQWPASLVQSVSPSMVVCPDWANMLGPPEFPALAVVHTRGDASVKAMLSAASPEAAM